MLRGVKKMWLVFGLLAAMLVAVVWITPRVGAIEHQGQQARSVFENLRRPRLHLAMLAGGALALSGMTFQAMFRNPLANEFTLGVTSGASLAMVSAMAIGLPPAWQGGLGRLAVALAGALAVVVLVYGLARLRRDAPISTLLLAGVCVNFICGAGIIIVQYWLREYEAKAMIHWLIGSVEAANPHQWSAIRLLAGILLAGSLLLVYLRRELDLLMMGESWAAGRGVDVGRARATAYFCASIMTAAVVAVCGPIAFVGLVVPNVMRLVVGPNHRVLLPACLMGGMILLPLCDFVARNVLGWCADSYYAELPVGVITNVVGGIVFLLILIRRKSDQPILA